MTAIITKYGALDMQLCVPASWSDHKIKDFADEKNPCGTKDGWQIRRQGDSLLKGASERVTCSANACCVHVMLDA